MQYVDQRKFTDLGFEKAIFYSYINLLPNDDYNAVDDLRFVIGQLKDLLRGKDILIEGYQMQIFNLKQDLAELRGKYNHLNKRIYYNTKNS